MDFFKALNESTLRIIVIIPNSFDEMLSVPIFGPTSLEIKKQPRVLRIIIRLMTHRVNENSIVVWKTLSHNLYRKERHFLYPRSWHTNLSKCSLTKSGPSLLLDHVNQPLLVLISTKANSSNTFSNLSIATLDFCLPLIFSPPFKMELKSFPMIQSSWIKLPTLLNKSHDCSGLFKLEKP